MRADDNYKLLQPILVIQKLLETLCTSRKTADNEIILKILLEPSSEALELKFLKNKQLHNLTF